MADSDTPPLATSAAELYRMATGVDLDEPDRRVLTNMLAQDTDCAWMAPEFVVPSGDGRTALEARALAGLFLLDEQVVWAVRGPELLKERFYWLRSMAEAPELWPAVSKVRRTNGEQRIEMRSGARLLFVPAGGASLRGLSADCIFLDSDPRGANALRTVAWPCLCARPNPQLVINYGSVEA